MLPNTNANIQICVLCLALFYSYLFFINSSKISNILRFLYRTKIFKLFLFFISYITILSMIKAFCGYYSAPVFYYLFRLIKVYSGMILVYLFPILALTIDVNLRKIFKIIIILHYIILFLGISQFLCDLIHFEIFDNIIKYTIANWRLLRNDEIDGAGYRCTSVFDEASSLGYFIVIMFPFAFNIAKTKFKVFHNKFINYVIKKTYLPFSFFCVIFTKSPVYTIICIIEFFIFNILYHREIIKKYYLYVLSFVLLFYIFIQSFINQFIEIFTNSYMKRFINFLYYCLDLNLLILKEPSLATRILSNMLNCRIFLKNILCGVGICNSEIYANKLFLKTGLLYTKEFINRYYNSNGPYALPLNKTLLWSGLSELGIVGWGAFLCFYIVSIYESFKYTKYYNGLIRLFFLSISQALVIVLILSIYSSYFDNYMMWLFLGFILTLIFMTKKQIIGGAQCIKY